MKALSEANCFFPRPLPANNPNAEYRFENMNITLSTTKKKEAQIQRSAKKYANLAKQDPGRARQNR